MTDLKGKQLAPSVAGPVAGAHDEANSAAVVKISNTQSGRTLRRTCLV